jgi:hypothetical protein
MFDFMIYIFINSFYISLIGGTSSLFLFRLYFVYKNKIQKNQALFVLFTPCSIGFFHTFTEEFKLKKWYRLLMVISFIFTFLGSLFILYLYLELNYI